MEKGIEETAHAILNEEDDEGDICSRIKVPKVLGDLLEAILGAIVVDQGMRLDEVRKVTLKLLEDQLDRFANPNRFKHNVISKLLLIVQKQFRICPDYVFLDEPDDTEKKCEVWVNNTRKLGEGIGPTRAIARRMATEDALKNLGAFTGRTVLGKERDEDLDIAPSKQLDEILKSRNFEGDDCYLLQTEEMNCRDVVDYGNDV